MKRVAYSIVFISTIFIFSNFIYAYKEYKIGDLVKYNDIDFYVIKDSSSEEGSITLLKKELLTVAEVNLYGGAGTDNNHVNKYTSDSIGTAYNNNGYGRMAYYSSVYCGWINGDYRSYGCTNDYETSDAKFLIDSWAIDKFKLEDLSRDSTGYSVRLINEEDLLNVGYYYGDDDSLRWENAPDWFHDQFYATMIPGYANGYIKYVDTIGFLNPGNVDGMYLYRPVVIIKKSSIENDDKQDEIIDDGTSKQSTETNKIEKQDTSNNVKVPNTLKSVSGLIMLIGLVIICISLNIFNIFKNKDKIKK